MQPNSKPDNVIQFPTPASSQSTEQKLDIQANIIKRFIFNAMPPYTEVKPCEGMPGINCSYAHAVSRIGVILVGFCYVPSIGRWTSFQPAGAIVTGADLVDQQRAKSAVQAAINTLKK